MIRRRTKGKEVILNIYDIEWSVFWPKKLVAYLGLGIFHTGVEVYGREFTYHGHADRTTGIFQIEPKCAQKDNNLCCFKTSLLIGHTKLEEEQVHELITNMGNIWEGSSYNLLSKNCNDFSNAFCEVLCRKRIPRWVNRLAKFFNAIPFLQQIVPTTWVQLQIPTQPEQPPSAPPIPSGCGCNGDSGGVQDMEVDSVPCYSASKSGDKVKQDLTFLNGRAKNRKSVNSPNPLRPTCSSSNRFGIAVDDSDDSAVVNDIVRSRSQPAIRSRLRSRTPTPGERKRNSKTKCTVFRAKSRPKSKPKTQTNKRNSRKRKVVSRNRSQSRKTVSRSRAKSAQKRRAKPKVTPKSRKRPCRKRIDISSSSSAVSSSSTTSSSSSSSRSRNGSRRTNTKRSMSSRNKSKSRQVRRK